MSLAIEHLTIKSSEQPLFTNINISVAPGNIVTLMGPSGCGKSTLLSLIAGHLSAEFSVTGRVTLDNRLMLDLPADQRKIGILFQDDLLFPHLNIYENLAFALPKSVLGKQRKAQALATLAKIGLADLAEKMPAQISGGQRARISLMRMLLSQPQAVLLDEPFSKLDKVLRDEFREFVFAQIKVLNVPALMVTHDDADVPAGSVALHWPWN